MTVIDKIDIIKQIYSTIEEPHSWKDVLHNISQQLGSSHAFIASRSSIDHSPSGFYEYGFDAGHFEQYQAHFYKVDLWTQGLALHQANQFHPSHLVCDDKLFQQSEIYTDFAKPAQIRNSIGCLLARPDGELISELAFMTGPDCDYYTKEQIELANAYLPHIEHALDIAQRLNFQQPIHHRYSVLDQLSDAMFICNGQADILYINRSADAMLYQSQLFKLPSETSKRLVFGNVSIHTEFMQALNRVSQTNAQSRSFYAWDKQNIYRVTLKPWVHQALTPLGEISYPCTLMTVQSSASKVVLQPKDIMSLFGLTLAEAEVCSLLCAGTLVNEIADKRSATPNTIRQQIKACLGKTATRNQAELVSKVILGLTLN